MDCTVGSFLEALEVLEVLERYRASLHLILHHRFLSSLTHTLYSCLQLSAGLMDISLLLQVDE